MSDQFIPDGGISAAAEAAPAAASGIADPTADSIKKKENKVRAAWISFTGRILAQCVGAAATVAFGLLFLQRHPPPPATHDTTNDTAKSAVGAAVPLTTTPARARRTGEVWLAVLPFEDYSVEQHDGPLVNAMTEALIASLSGVRGLRVVSRTSSMHHKGSTRALPEVARELGVDWVVEGSICRVRDRVRVTTQLIDATSDEHVWAHAYDRPFVDALALQAQLASLIAKSVDLALRERQNASTSSDVAHPENPAPRPLVVSTYTSGRS